MRFQAVWRCMWQSTPELHLWARLTLAICIVPLVGLGIVGAVLDAFNKPPIKKPPLQRYTYAMSTTGKTIISFDAGASWRWDDGPCQMQRDRQAELWSYWPTTLRVDANMDPFWLPNEERICQSYPNDKGRVSLVSCPASESRSTHNIPIRFWGGVDRGITSDWECRREGDEFACRAVN
jgi:hypothetical protein